MSHQLKSFEVLCLRFHREDDVWPKSRIWVTTQGWCSLDSPNAAYGLWPSPRQSKQTTPCAWLWLVSPPQSTWRISWAHGSFSSKGNQLKQSRGKTAHLVLCVWRFRGFYTRALLLCDVGRDWNSQTMSFTSCLLNLAILGHILLCSFSVLLYFGSAIWSLHADRMHASNFRFDENCTFWLILTLAINSGKSNCHTKFSFYTIVLLCVND